MQETELRRYLEQQGLSPNTQSNCVSALKRLEKAHSMNLDEEFEKDQLASVSRLLAYSSIDARSARENPSKLSIDQEKLYAHLAWYRSHLNTYRKFKGGGPIPVESEMDLQPTAVDNDTIAQIFGLERDLQAALRKNINQLENGLTIIDGGSEKRVEGGFIDILARDQSGVTTVVELKVETARPAVVAQILAYMGCISEETGGAAVRGIIVASDYDKRVELAARAIPNLTLKRYRFRFEFS